MSVTMDESIKRWTAKRKAASVGAGLAKLREIFSQQSVELYVKCSTGSPECVAKLNEVKDHN